jgi:predicted dithiol-disulfide oxidoreductase (DUF899 family)
MAAAHDSYEGNESAAIPPIVDRATWQAARDELLVREKAHMRAGDMLAAARRRLPMVEVDATTSVVGPDGPRTLLDLFEGREELVVYRHMWFPGEPVENQCEGCTMTYWATQSPVYLNARGVSFAVFAPGPYSELAPFIEFMGYRPCLPHQHHDRPGRGGLDGGARPARPDSARPLGSLAGLPRGLARGQAARLVLARS